MYKSQRCIVYDSICEGAQLKKILPKNKKKHSSATLSYTVMRDIILDVVVTESNPLLRSNTILFQVQSGKSLQTLVGLSGGLAHELPCPLR